MLVGPSQIGLGLGPWQAELLAKWQAVLEHLLAGPELRLAGLKL